MKRICRRWLILIVLIFAPSFVSAAEEGGSLSVFVFAQGKPLANIEIIVDGQAAYRTDSDGSRKIRLSAGRHGQADPADPQSTDPHDEFQLLVT